VRKLLKTGRKTAGKLQALKAARMVGMDAAQFALRIAVEFCSKTGIHAGF
jgi:lipid A disaccharide synthetase